MKTGIERFDERSAKNLVGVHADLIRVVEAAAEICEIDFVVIEGLRTMKRQRELVAKGASQTLKSRHLDGHAIDVAPIVDGDVSFAWPPFDLIAAAMKTAANNLGVSIIWGGDWRKFRDGPHFELDRKAYPSS